MADQILNKYNFLRTISFNSTGFSDQKRKLIYKISQMPSHILPIICNQENFVLKSNMYMIKQTLPNFHVVFKPAVKQNLNAGRPKNGMFVAYPDDVIDKVTDISPKNPRIQCLLFQLNTCAILFMNVYFPTDNRSNEVNYELHNVLLDMKNLILSENYNQIIINGDVNCDFNRNTYHVSAISLFLEEFHLIDVWDMFPVEHTYIFNREGISYSSIIDHCFISTGLMQNVQNAGTIDDSENTSNHLPIFVQLTINELEANVVKANCGRPKISWKSASDNDKENYTLLLNELLNVITPNDDLLYCNNCHCMDVNHNTSIDEYVHKIMEAVDLASVDALPKHSNGSKSSNTHIIPGWNDLVLPFKYDADFWHSIWISAGKPLNNQLHNIMKHTRNLYHYQVRKCKRAADKIKSEKYLSNCMNKSNDIFRDIKHSRSVKKGVANCIDGVTDDIHNHFGEIYKGLYNRNNENSELLSLKRILDTKIDERSLNDIELITPSLVKIAVENLKSSKYDPYHNFNSDCLLNAPNSLFIHLAKVFKMYLIHNYIPQSILFTIICPIVKNENGNINSSENYRSVAIGSLILKIFDWIVITLFSGYLELDDLQFAYQKDCSPSLCTWMVIETVNYFLSKGSNVYICLFDMKKAFDLISHFKLFKKLMKTDIPSIFIRLILFIYMSQYSSVKWNETYSEYFFLRNGVRQGAVLSGIFFCLYMNDFYIELRRRKIGCWVNGNYHGGFGFSDDITLLAPSITALQDMINFSSDYARDHDLIFSTDPNPTKSKSKCMAFSKSKQILPPIFLNDTILPWVSEAKHLGNTISTKHLNMGKDINIKRAIFIQRAIELNQEFYFCHPDSKHFINQKYNNDFSGSICWDLFSKEFESLGKSWNVNIRKMYNLPLETHKYLLEPLTSCSHIKINLMKRFIKFISNCTNSKKHVVKDFVNVIKYNTLSITGRNLRKIMLLLNKSDINDINVKDFQNIFFYSMDVSNNYKIQLLKDMINIRHYGDTIDNFSNLDIQNITNWLCCS